MNKEQTLHVYSQYGPHDDAVVVGTKASLIALRDAIGRALESGDASCEGVTADGEYFQVVVMCRESQSYYDKVGLPYASDAYVGSGASDYHALDPRDPEADEE